MEFLAPAKINLSLRVLRRREDGFHEIDTLMAPLSIFDTLDIERRETGGLAFTCSEPGLPVDRRNLVVRAVEEFCESFGFRPHLKIHLKKEIPHGAGLGGGSSDAATTLLALDHLFQTMLPREELVDLAAAIGSDIPFFLVQGVARCRGRGEIVEPATLPETLPVLLIKPPFGVPTPWAYQQWKDSLEIPGIDYEPQKLPWGELVNDLERPVFQKFLQLAEMKRWLLAQPETAGALMSGSGSTMFAVLRSKAEGMELAQRVAVEFGQNLWVGLTETV
jgi:4-diphosphocytidyl-2-C-methyl-D-erythritol kinase